MKFKKILTVGVREGDLDVEFWRQLDEMGESRVSLDEDDPKVSDELADAECLLVKFNKADKAMMEAAPNLKYVGALATGYGKIDLSYASQKQIVVTNVPGYSTESVAEFIIAVILEKIRGLSNGLKRVGGGGDYSEAGLRATEIKGKNFGVVGLGQIGSRVAELAKGFGANVGYYSRNDKNVAFQYKDLDALLADSDLISINLALTADTEGILNPDRINLIKPGTIVVNTAPMELLDLSALEQRLKKSEITFITDHSDEMDEQTVQRLKQYDNCILYPPIAYISDEAKIAKQEIFIANIKAFLENTPQNKVN